MRVSAGYVPLILRDTLIDGLERKTLDDEKPLGLFLRGVTFGKMGELFNLSPGFAVGASDGDLSRLVGTQTVADFDRP